MKWSYIAGTFEKYRGINIYINIKPVKHGKNFRFGHSHTLEGSDLIVWLNIESTDKLKVSLAPVEK